VAAYRRASRALHVLSTVVAVAPLLGGATLLSGCHCLNFRDAAAAREELTTKNRRNAERVMRDAAQRLGAVFLPAGPVDVRLVWSCDASVALGASAEEPCVRESTVGGRVLRVVTADQKPHLAVMMRGIDDWEYARLARRGTTLVVLEPKITHLTVGSMYECECNRCATVAMEPHTFGFVIDDANITDVRDVQVPMTEDVLEVKCKSCGL
jgi:hypothetical protein